MAPSANHSYRGASIGLTRDAFVAGWIPNTTPTTVETPHAVSTEAVVTIVSNSGLGAKFQPAAAPSKSGVGVPSKCAGLVHRNSASLPE
jgi:hypothetical protein